MSPILTIGTRGSALALWQARFIQRVIKEQQGTESNIRIIKTKGDHLQGLSFEKMESKGFFTKEIEDALLAGEIDLAVHSLKDLMTTQPPGLTLGAVGYRADRRELLLISERAVADGAPLPVKEGAVIGTSSARRKSQVASFLPSAKIHDLRGNVLTRVQKLRYGEYDAIVIAAAGAERLQLDFTGLIAVHLPADKFLPAPAQGVLGIQIREGDRQTAQVISSLNCPDTAHEVHVERGLLARFNAGCSLPLGVFCRVDNGAVHLLAVLGKQDGSGWSGLRRVEIEAENPDEAVDCAYRELTREPVSCD